MRTFKHNLQPEIVNLDEMEFLSDTSSCMLIPSDMQYYSNLTDVPTNDEDKIVQVMKMRYMRKDIYTWAGQTLLAVNPYEDKQEAQLNLPSIKSLIYKVWFRLQYAIGKKNQAIVISGESGAGKTFTACMALKYIANREQETPGNPFDNILWQVWSSVPLLAAFGNASTDQNHNSSRFGKLLQLQYVSGRIKGAYIETYMLEKSRVAGPNAGDSNFGIFRQVLDNLDDETLSFLYLRKSTDYKIAPKIGLKTSYAETVKALEILNITELDKILIVLSVVLNLGNVTFENFRDFYVVSDESFEYAENVAKLLHIPTKNLVEVLCNAHFSARRRDSVFKSPCRNREECEERRNCIMKYLYEKLFAWLVRCINTRTYDSGHYNLIGLLDIYGFESLANNTFEQLCINYANERMQQYFVDNFIQHKRNELMEDGFDIESINTSEYVKRICILDGPISIFAILNEECAVKRFNNDLFVNTRLTETLRGKEHFLGSASDLSTTFSIKHYAGCVKYNTKTMLCKNRDKVPEDIIDFLKNSNFFFLQNIINDGTMYNGRTLISNFKKSLDTLVQILDTCDVHYIKCLKPNPFKVSEFFVEDYFKQQMISNGVFHVLKLNFQKYSIKFNFEEFSLKYSCRMYNLLQETLKEEMHLGKRDIYLTEAGYFTFERLKLINRSMQARKIQWGWFKYFNRRKNAAITIQRFVRKTLGNYTLAKYEKFIDLSKKSSDMQITNKIAIDLPYSKQVEQYLVKNRFDLNYEGDQLSLSLERIYNRLKTQPFKRVLFCGDRIVSFNRLAEIPVRFHTSKTCMRYSYLLPKSELANGLTDIF